MHDEFGYADIYLSISEMLVEFFTRFHSSFAWSSFIAASAFSLNLLYFELRKYWLYAEIVFADEPTGYDYEPLFPTDDDDDELTSIKGMDWQEIMAMFDR